MLTPLIHLSGHLIGRWPGLYSALNLAILIAANALPFSVAVHDKVSDGRVHPISLWVPVLRIVETFGLIAVVMPSDGWRRLALWLVSSALRPASTWSRGTWSQGPLRRTTEPVLVNLDGRGLRLEGRQHFAVPCIPDRDSTRSAVGRANRLFMGISV